MARLIDAEHLAWNVKGIKCGKLTVKHLLWILENQEPTVDAEPVRHGKWVTNRIGMFECTNCKKMIFERSRLWSYCPMCGALMDGEEE